MDDDIQTYNYDVDLDKCVTPFPRCIFVTLCACT